MLGAEFVEKPEQDVTDDIAYYSSPGEVEAGES